MAAPVNNLSIRELLLASNLPDLKKPADLLPVVNPLLKDAVFLPANNGGLHKRPVNVSEALENSRALNGGAVETKVKLTPVIAGMGINEEHLVDDQAAEDLNEHIDDWLQADEETKIKHVGIGVGNRLLYADPVVDDSVGFNHWFKSKSEKYYGDQIIDAGGAEANGLTSVLLIIWAPSAVYGIHPRKRPAGMRVHLFQSDAQTGANNSGVFEGNRIGYSMISGLFVEAPKYAVRIANIPTSATELAAINLIDLLDEALLLVDPAARMLGIPVFYMNSKMIKKYKDDVKNSPNAAFAMSEIQKSAELQYDGVPVSRLDLIRNAESLVV